MQQLCDVRVSQGIHGFQLVDDAIGHDQVQEVVFAEISVRHPDRNFPRRTQTIAATLVGHLALVNMFVQEPSHPVVHGERD